MKSKLARYTRYLRYLKESLGTFIVAIFFGILYGASSGFGMPVIFDKVLRQIFLAKDAGEEYSVWTILGIASMLPAIFLLRAITGYLSGYFMSVVSLTVLRKIKQDIFSRIQDYPMPFFDKFTKGDLFVRLSSDTASIQAILLAFSSEIFRQPLQVIGALAFLIYISITKGEVVSLFVFLLATPFCILPVQLVRKRFKRNARLAQEGLSDITQIFNENLGAAHEVRLFGLQESQKSKFEKLNLLFQRLSLGITRYELVQQPFMEILAAIMVSITFVYAYIAGIDFATFSAIGIALYFTIDPIKRVVRMLSDFIKTTPLFDRINEILDYESTVPEPKNPVKIDTLKGEFTFKDAEFAYEDKVVLSDVSITIPAGTSCALVGESGAGKSTFAKLAMRLYDTQKGSIEVDGISVKDIATRDYYANIGSVPQYPVLFNDTIYNNILLAKPNATKEEVETAAKLAYADEFIKELEDGYDTIVGERGDKLSGGQKQRIALARVFLKNPSIVVLDEATSALDVNSELFIQKALDNIMQEKTVFIIAHRFTTIRNVKKIIVFKEGKIIAFGSHTELYETCPHYKMLYDRQSMSQQ